MYIRICWLFSRIFQRKVSANRLGWAGGVHNEFKVLVKVLFSDNNSDVFEKKLLIHGTFIDTYVRYCTKQELLLCCAYCGNYFPLNLVKILFSDNNSELIATWNINKYICKVLHRTRIITLTCLL